jgi:hypothetical protein
VSLTAACDDDDNPGNNTFSRQVFVRAPWVPCAPGYQSGVVDADTATVYLADRQTSGVMRYFPVEDSWEPVQSTPFSAGSSDLGYWDGSLYALGSLSADRPGAKAGLPGSGRPRCDESPGAIYKLALGDTAWEMVCESLPDSTQPGWLIPTGSGLYLLPAAGAKLVRFDTTSGWTEMNPVPVAVVSCGAADWDRTDTIFFTFVSDSGAKEFLSYSVAGDTWRTLTAPPESGMALAVEPGGVRILMTTLDSMGSVLYEYDRDEDAWTRLDDTPPQTWPGMSFCFAGSDAWLVTGGPTQGSSFWRYDPDYPGGADHKGKLGGVAGWVGQLQQPCLNCEPNPFTGSCRITYALPKPGRVSLKLYDVSGRLVTTLANGYTPTGRYVTNVYSRDLACGVYMLKLESADFRATRKLILE